jgi:hypothetical protein
MYQKARDMVGKVEIFVRGIPARLYGLMRLIPEERILENKKVQEILERRVRRETDGLERKIARLQHSIDSSGRLGAELEEVRAENISLKDSAEYQAERANSLIDKLREVSSPDPWLVYNHYAEDLKALGFESYLLVDPDGKIGEIDSKALKLMGIDRGKLVGEDYEHFVDTFTSAKYVARVNGDTHVLSLPSKRIVGLKSISSITSSYKGDQMNYGAIVKIRRYPLKSINHALKRNAKEESLKVESMRAKECD